MYSYATVHFIVVIYDLSVTRLEW